MNMPDHPEQPDDVEVLLRNYAASRQTFAANAPDLHEADIRRLAAEACKERHKGAPVAASLWDRWRGFFGSLTTPQWSAAAVTAAILLFFAVWLPLRQLGGESHVAKVERGTPAKTSGSGSQLFTMVATVTRGEARGAPDHTGGGDAATRDPAGVHSAEAPTQTPAHPQGDYRNFDLTLNLDGNEMALKFSDGTLLAGSLRADDGGNPVASHEAMSYAVSASGSDPQKQPIGFKGVLVAVRASASSNRAKEVSLRGILTANQREFTISAGMKNP